MNLGPLGPLGIVADDLTGGAAIAAEIARDSGATVEVIALGRHASDGSGPVVIETGSRYVDTADAAARVVQAVAHLRERGYRRIMKKIDSTLKGNVAIELATFVSTVGGPVVIAPACPSVGLSVLGGVQTRDGVAMRDIRVLLDEVLPVPPEWLPLEIVRAGADELARAISAMADRPTAPVILADGETDADLQAVAHGSVLAGVAHFAGTYGLGAALEQVAASPRRAHAVKRLGSFGERAVERMIVIIGSMNVVSTAQRQRLVELGASETAVNVLRLLDDDGAEAARVRASVAAASAPIVVVHSDAGLTSDEVSALVAANGWTDRELAERIVEPFADAIQSMPGSAVYFVGGETTGAVCDVLGWHRFLVLDEMTAAVPLAVPESGEHPYVLTKPGAFGGPDDLLISARRLLAWHPSVSADRPATEARPD